MLHLRLCVLGLILLSSPAGAQAPAALEGRIDALVGQMTLEEKVGQLIITGVDQKDAPEIVARGGAGATIGFNTAEGVADIQSIARKSRLGIPLLTGLDVLHGYRTLFPMPLAEAASFNPALARRSAELSAREAMAAGVNWTFSPMVDVSRDSRWGRIIEGSGEDVLLSRTLARARVEGYHAGGMAVSLKHFAGYGGVGGGRDYDSASIPANELWEEHYPPFQAGLAAGADTVMTALSVLNGIPSTVDTTRITDVLKGAWGFDGFVVSDWSAIGDLIKQGVAADGAEAARKAILAGVDMDMMSGFYAQHLVDEVRAGRVPVARIDDAVRRVLRVKLRSGLFERPQPDPASSDAAALTPELRQAAREIARDTMVLLRNEGGVLPLKSTDKNVAVIGYLAGNSGEQLGPHEARGRADEAVSILDGVREQAAAKGVTVRFAEGCERPCTDDKGFADAVEAARQSDVVVAVLGEPREFSGEAATRAHLGLWGRQEELLDALVATGKPVVLAIMAGRPLDLRRIVDRVPAIMMVWYPGTEGGPAFADLLFGAASPSAHLPLSWPRSVGQLPMRYDILASGRPTEPEARFTLKYLDEGLGPLFPFGYGLSYTRFSYSGLKVVTPAIAEDGTLEVGVDLHNDGDRAGTEIVQLYVRDEVSSHSRPVRQLKAFERVTLEPGETRTVHLRVAASDLGFMLEDGRHVVEPGTFRIWVGGDSRATLEAGFEVLPSKATP
jgi:beta-glucosidase